MTTKLRLCKTKYRCFEGVPFALLLTLIVCTIHHHVLFVRMFTYTAIGIALAIASRRLLAAYVLYPCVAKARRRCAGCDDSQLKLSHRDRSKPDAREPSEFEGCNSVWRVFGQCQVKVRIDENYIHARLDPTVVCSLIKQG
jgi:hypothetical protein